jgi:beta-glucosidase
MSEQATRLIAAMTLEEQVALLSGSELFETTGVERLGIPRIRMLDGPGGVRGTDFLAATSLAIPCGSALGATWDPVLIEAVGAVLGRQARAKGARLHLAPTLNLCRTPTGGRNFESFGEDPLLVAATGVAYVRGVQSEGVGSCLKHFVGNDTEQDRFTANVTVDDRTLHEVYLRPFEAAVREGNAMAVMSSYNSVNGTTMTEHHHLLEGVLRDQWGFLGAVVGDWYGVRSTVEALAGGTDLEMPGPGSWRGPKLLDAVSDGLIDPTVVARAASRVLALLDATGGLDDDGPGPESTLDTAADRATIRSAAAQAMVLLKNDLVGGESILPLRAIVGQRVAVIGPNAAHGAICGGGSAMVRPTSVSNPLTALRARLPDVRIDHCEGDRIDVGLPMLDVDLCTDLRVELFDDPEAVDAPDSAHRVPTKSFALNTSRLLWFRDPFDATRPPLFSARLRATFIPDSSGDWTFGVRSVGDGRMLVDGEVVGDNYDTQLGEIAAMGKPEIRVTVPMTAGAAYELEFRLRRRSEGDGLSGLLVGAAAPIADDPIADAVALARSSDISILVVGTNGDWETEGRDRTSLSLPGQQDELVRRVAEVSKRTVVVVNAGAPVAMPWIDDVDAVVVAWFPGELMGDALVDVLLGDTEPQGRLPVTFPRTLADSPQAEMSAGVDGVIAYSEGRLIGHRWYDANNVDPLFPFGFGLGYADVELVAAARIGSTSVSVDLANRTDRPGVQVVQVYVACAPMGLRRDDDEPIRRLAGFVKVHVPAKGVVQANVDLDPRAFQTWDSSTSSWVDVGDRPLLVGTSLRHLPFVLP